MADLNAAIKLLGPVGYHCCPIVAFLNYASICYPIHIASLSTTKIKTQHISQQEFDAISLLTRLLVIYQYLI